MGAIYVPSTIGDIRGLMPRLGGPQPVGTRSNQIGTAGRQPLDTTGRTVRIGHIVPYACTDLQLLFGNYYSGGWGETPNTDDINVEASIEYPLGAIWPAFFNGQRVVNLLGGCLIKTDPLGLQVRADVTGTCTDNAATTTSFTTSLTGDYNNAYGGQILQFTSGANTGQRRYITQTGFNTSTGAVTVDVAFPSAPANGDTFKIVPVVYSRTFVCAASGTKNVPVGFKLLGGGASSPFEGSSTGVNYVDGTGTPGNSTSTCYSPLALLGQPLGGVIPAIALGGDSIMNGTGDPDHNATNSKGFGVRALNDLFPWVQISKSGEQTIHFTNVNPSLGSRLRRAAALSGCTHVVFNYGTNDLGGRTAAQIKATIIEIARSLIAKGIKVYWCTLLPKTGSTDSWATVVNQTVTANESVRLALNAWLRDTSASGYVAQAGGSKVAGYFEVANTVEVNASNVLTQNGGFWKAPGSIAESGTASAATTTTLTDSSKTWTTNQWAGYYVYIYGGTGAGQVPSYVISNTATQLTLNTAWIGATPDATSQYRLVASYTTDGTHPTLASHLLMAAGINTAVFTV